MDAGLPTLSSPRVRTQGLALLHGVHSIELAYFEKNGKVLGRELFHIVNFEIFSGEHVSANFPTFKISDPQNFVFWPYLHIEWG